MDLRSMDNEERLAGQFRRVRCASAFDEEGKYRLLWKSKGEKLIWYISFTGHSLSVVFEAAQPCFASCRLVMPFFSLRQEGARLYIDVDWHRPAEDFLLLVRELVAVTDQIEDVMRLCPWSLPVCAKGWPECVPVKTVGIFLPESGRSASPMQTRSSRRLETG